MKPFLVYLSAVLLLVAVQSVFFPGVRPDLVLVIVCLYSLKYGTVKGVPFGAAAGFVLDSASGFIIGPNVISKILAVFLINYIRRKFFTWNSILCAVVILGITLVDLLWVYFFMRTFSRLLPMGLISDTAMIQAAYTSAAAFLLYHVVRPEAGVMHNG